jgi:hypothetical protein|tara:strand:+ start:112 stop:294 length:183 start_codon:yes stop_codon:yes gene_type:complete
MSVSEQIEAAIEALQELKSDAEKVDKGMAGAPGTRIRKVAMTIKKSMDGVRKGVLEARNS